MAVSPRCTVRIAEFADNIAMTANGPLAVERSEVARVECRHDPLRGVNSYPRVEITGAANPCVTRVSRRRDTEPCSRQTFDHIVAVARDRSPPLSDRWRTTSIATRRAAQRRTSTPSSGATQRVRCLSIAPPAPTAIATLACSSPSSTCRLEYAWSAAIREPRPRRDSRHTRTGEEIHDASARTRSRVAALVLN